MTHPDTLDRIEKAGGELRMGRPFPLRFQLPSSAKCLRVERVADDQGISSRSSHWRLWLMANGDFTLGTFIQLLDNGKVNRVTWHEDGTGTVLEVRW